MTQTQLFSYLTNASDNIRTMMLMPELECENIDFENENGIFSQMTDRRRVCEIIRCVNNYYGIDILSHTRKRQIIKPRQIAQYLARVNTGYSLDSLGMLIGNKDHATILHSFNTVKSEMELYPSFYAEVEDLSKIIGCEY